VVASPICAKLPCISERAHTNIELVQRSSNGADTMLMSEFETRKP
jgi:hypothetical protein